MSKYEYTKKDAAGNFDLKKKQEAAHDSMVTQRKAIKKQYEKRMTYQEKVDIGKIKK